MIPDEVKEITAYIKEILEVVAIIIALIETVRKK